MSPLTIGAPTAHTAPGAIRIEGLRDARYGEVFLARETGGSITVEVWNTLGLNDCPQSAWDALDPTRLAEQHGAIVAILNGPRHWLLDAIENVPHAERREATFGDLQMFLAATVDLGSKLPDRRPYTQLFVNRDTVWEWSAGRTVHELTSDTGDTYVMQAYCLAVEPDLTEEALGHIGPRLNLPSGWRYRSRQLDAPLRVRAIDGVGTVTQDDLQNTYHLCA